MSWNSCPHRLARLLFPSLASLVSLAASLPLPLFPFYLDYSSTRIHNSFIVAQSSLSTAVGSPLCARASQRSRRCRITRRSSCCPPRIRTSSSAGYRHGQEGEVIARGCGGYWEMWRKLKVDGFPPSSVSCSSALSSFFVAFVSRHRTHFPMSDSLLLRFSTFIGAAFIRKNLPG